MAQKTGRAPTIKAEIVVPEAPFSTPLGIASSVKVVEHKKGTPVLECVVATLTKEPVLDENGRQLFRMDRKKNELGARHRYVRKEQTVRFWMRRTPRGHIRLQQDFQPSAEELALADRQRQVAAFQEGLAEAAVSRGITPEQLVSQLLDQPVEPKAEEKSEEGAPVSVGVFPKNRGAIGWELSDGSLVKGENAEGRARMQQAKLDSQSPPAE